jgi:hypothetical protein
LATHPEAATWPKGKTVLPAKPADNSKLFHFLVRSVLPARIAKLLRLQTIGVLLLILCRCVVAVFAIPALQRNGFPHAFVSLPDSLYPEASILIDAEGR